MQATWNGRRVLITGHTGFKGSWLALWLQHLGAEVAGYALAPETEPSHFELIALDQLVNHHQGDIRDIEKLRKVTSEFRPEVVIHMAAQALVLRSYDQPKETFDINIGGTVNVLEVVRELDSVSACIVVTSDKCYENKDFVWGYRENDRLGGSDPYSASKGAAEIVFEAYRRSVFQSGERQIGLATVRAGNVIGGGDWAEYRIVPDCVRALSAGRKIPVRNPQAVRPWQHVLEPLGGYLLLGQRLLTHPAEYSGAWNFGPGASEAVRVEQLVNQFVKAWGSGAVELNSGDEQPRKEARVLRLCTDKARYDLDWSPILSGPEAISWTADWYQAWHA
ncbi:CDP-glucose 4,6-dehydratase, partial [Myxococcota bacterium]